MSKYQIEIIAESDKLNIMRYAKPMWMGKDIEPRVCNHTCFLGNQYWSLSLDMNAYGLQEEKYERMDAFPAPVIFSPRYKAVTQGTIWVSDLRAQVLDIIREMKDVDIEKCPHAYPLQLAECRGAVVIEDKKFPITLIEHATRLMFLAGMEAVDVDIEDRLISFVGYHKCELVAAVTVATVDYADKYCDKVLGSICLHPIDAAFNDVDSCLIHDTILSLDNLDSFVSEECKKMNNLYAVELAMYHTVYVLAKDETTACEIAMRETSSIDFTNGFEVGNVESIDYFDIEGTNCDVKTEDGTINESNLKHLGFIDDNEDEEEDSDNEEEEEV